jgi:putative tributyrin esterase
VSIFGPKLDVTGTDAELTHLATGLAKRPVKPKLYLSCGTEDELLPDTREFHQHLEKVGVPHTYSEGPGNHEWRYWDQEIQKVINWLPILLGSPA